jgi:thiol:disulfide interchange protein
MTLCKEIIEEVNVVELMNLQKCIDEDGDKVLVVKFTATWCRPCQTIKQVTHECFANLPRNVIIAEVDVDNNMDLYMFMKNKRIVKGIPSILVWYPNHERDLSRWYIPDDSISGSSHSDIFALFKRCNTKSCELHAN